MVNERMLNVPAELSPVLVENLERDLRWVKNDSALKEDRSIFSALTHVLLLAPCWTDATPKTTSSSLSSSSSSSVIAKSNFLHFEEEVFAKESIINFEINDVSTLTSTSSSKGSSTLKRPQSKRVIVMPLSVLTKCVTETKRLVKNAEEEEKESLKQQIAIINPSKKQKK
jgi:hypothetical protein